MSNIEKITEYVEGVFDLYDLNKYGFFFKLDDEMVEVDMPLFSGAELDKTTLHRVSVATGLTEEEILNTDVEAANRYWDKYDFFRLYKEYMLLREWNSRYKDEAKSKEQLLLKLFLDERSGIAKYDINSIRSRLEARLKEFEDVIPGTYHYGAEITDLRIYTENFLSFPKCADMVSSFVDMVNRIKELFFKAIRYELSGEETNELNFLATRLNAVDVVCPDVRITYDNVRTYSEVYREEAYNDFYDYVNIKAFAKTCPWRCKEFLEDMDLVKEFVHIFPNSKAEMGKFAINANNFRCEFIWSDAEPIKTDEFDALAWLDPIPKEKCAKEKTSVYIEKTKEELGKYRDFAKRLQKAAGPASKGGLEIPYRHNALRFDITRMKKRIDVRRGGVK